jgi:hypothetical protein
MVVMIIMPVFIGVTLMPEHIGAIFFIVFFFFTKGRRAKRGVFRKRT